VTKDMVTFTEEELFADRLEEMLKLQEQLQLRFLGANPYFLGGERRKNYVKEMVLATTDELHEALREVPWKSWSKNVSGDNEKFKDELVDALHFFLNLMLVSGMTADELFTRYLRKNNVNHGRIDDGYASTTG
jgi:dimeric dUTPase (all-alpha-NTP-PPase superfamily)